MSCQQGGRERADRERVVMLGIPDPAVTKPLQFLCESCGVAQGIRTLAARLDHPQFQCRKRYFTHAIRWSGDAARDQYFSGLRR